MTERIEMHKQAMVFIAAAAFTAGAAASERLCVDSRNTVEETECLNGELAKAEKVLADYLGAAKERIAKENEGVPKLDAAQSAWTRYRSAQCGDVYRYWEQGTYRYRAELECDIALTRSRTHDIWSAYLVYGDSTPPLRPEP